MMRLRTLLLLPLLLAFEAAAVVALHRFGDVPGLEAATLVAAHAAPQDALMAAARLVALAVGWWLLVTTLLCCAARTSRLPGALRAVEWAALPPVRRLVERSLAATLSLSAAAAVVPAVEASPAVAAERAPVPAVEGGVVVPPALAMTAPEAHSAPAPPAGLPPLPPHGHAAPAGLAGELPRRHEVVEGEHLWGLARAAVAEATGRSGSRVAPAEVAAYWVRLIEANPSSLRSGDPDLVHPGEVLTLPPHGA